MIDLICKATNKEINLNAFATGLLEMSFSKIASLVLKQISPDQHEDKC